MALKPKAMSMIEPLAAQFRTFRSAKSFKPLQVVLSVKTLKNIGILHAAIHFFGRAIAFEVVFDGSKPYSRVRWNLLDK